MLKNLNIVVLALVALAIVFPLQTEAKIGVGVGTGKIEVDEGLMPGTIYRLPSISVINTGDIEGSYSLKITYHNQQEEIRPEAEWFKFSPSEFSLEPGQIQVVDITLDLPVKVVPGKYFAYVEAYPLSNNAETGGATVGIAAASKLYFDVEPANAVLGVYYKAVSLWNYYAPWSGRVTLILGAIVVLVVTKKYLNIDIKLKKSDEKSDE
jgi:hypothetical protein